MPPTTLLVRPPHASRIRTVELHHPSGQGPDKALLDLCREALGIAGSAMRLDGCELWNLAGKRGRITTWGDGRGYLLAIYERDSRQAWTWAKKRLGAKKLDRMWGDRGVGRLLAVTVTP